MTAGTQYAPVVVQGPTATEYTGASKAYPIPVTAGNLLIAAPYASNLDSQVSDSQGNVWVEDAATSNGATDFIGLWHTIAKRTGPNTVSFTGSSASGWLFEISMANKLDAVNSGGGVGVTTWNAGTIHVKQKVEFIIARIWTQSGGITTVPGWILFGGSLQSASHAVNYLIAGNGFDGAVSGGCTVGNEVAVVASFSVNQTFSFRPKCRPLGV